MPNRKHPPVRKPSTKQQRPGLQASLSDGLVAGGKWLGSAWDRLQRRPQLWLGLRILGGTVFGAVLVIIGLLGYVKQSLPALTSITGRNLAGSVAYYDRTGKVMLWEDYESVKRIPMDSSDISPYLKQATVAIEDHNFYHGDGVSFTAVARAALHDIFHPGGGLQGASTITQQLVKLNEGWPDPLSVPHKVDEFVLAIDVSHEYSKNDILTAYLNIAPYGNVDYGAEAAAQDYFHTSAKNLSLAQAALLAAIPQAPSSYSPYSSPTYNPAVTVDNFDAKGLLARQHYVLDQMVGMGYLTQAQADAAKQVDVLAQIHPLQSKFDGIQAPYFVLAAKQQLLQKYGAQMLKHDAWRVTTTLDVSLQQLADKVVQDNAGHAQDYGADEEALVAEQVKTGQVVALVGGTDFSNPQYGQINYAQTNIQPGSSIKPYVYSTFINDPSKNAGAGSVIYDNQQPLPGYPCTDKNRPKDGGNCLWDYDFRYPGPATIRYDLAGSRNVPAVKAGLMAGIGKMQTTADAMMSAPGAYKCFRPDVSPITATKDQEVPCYGSAAIGDGYLHLDQTVNGLSSLARMGKSLPQTYLLQIQDMVTHDVIYRWKQPAGQQVIDPDTAYIINDMLSDPRASYLPGSCNDTGCSSLASGGYKWQRYDGWHIAIKTGTNNSNFSGLMTAWDTQYAVATWVGYHTVNKPLVAGSMEYLTEPLARGWMQGALDTVKSKPANWTAPSDIKTAPAYVVHQHIGVGSQEPSPATDIYPHWYKPPAHAGQRVTIDKVSGLQATACTPPAALVTSTDDDAKVFSVDTFVGTSTNTGNTDNIHNCSDTKPSISLSGPAGGICKDTDNGGRGCLITATVAAGTHPLSSDQFPGSIIFAVNGRTVATDGVSGASDTAAFYYRPDSNGSVTVTATVTDSVLYQSQDSLSLTTEVQAAAPLPKPKHDGGRGAGDTAPVPTATTPPPSGGTTTSGGTGGTSGDGASGSGTGGTTTGTGGTTTGSGGTGGATGGSGTGGTTTGTGGTTSP